MPELKFNKSVVVFAAHPDDTEIFVAGTLALLKKKGYRLTVCTLTAGGMGAIGSTEKKTIAMRKIEARKAAEVLGAEYYCLDGRDGYLFDTEALRIRALDLIRKQEAGIVITHLPMDYHADHRATSSIVDAAAMLSTLPNCPSRYAPLPITPLFYHSATLGLTDPLGNAISKPHFYVNIESVEEEKMRMLSFHQSQIELMRVMHKMDDFFGEMKKQDIAWGREAGCAYAEAYWQHLGGGFQKVPLIQEELSEFIVRPR